jgi:ABC-type branched-subunit amino acid transport system ATPase component/branched-subunit amino acid ABC-type transport system permease component
VGLVLTYKTSRVFNFAHGALGTLAAYLFYSLHFTHHVAWPLAALLVVGLVGPVVGIAFESFGRELSRVTVIWQIAATVGILMTIEAVCIIAFGSATRVFPHVLPTTTFKLTGVYITYEQLIVVGISALATGTLWLSFRLTRTGLAMRAVVEEPQLLALARTNPSIVRRVAWIIGVSFAMLSGLLIAPSVGLDPEILTLLIFQAFGAAAIGRFSSIPMTWAGGIALGVAASLLTKYGTNSQLVSGLAPSLPIIVLIVVLVLARSRLRDREVVTLVRPIQWRSPGSVQIAIGVAVVTVLIFVPQLVGYRVDSYTLMLTSVLLFLSLGLLVRVAGQASLCQVSFAAIGATTFSHFAHGFGIPWLPSLILAPLVAVPIGLLLAIPAIRVSPLYLGLITLGFGLMLQNMFYQTRQMFGPGANGILMPQPHLSWLHVDTSTGFYYVVLFITVLVALGMVALSRSRLGRSLRGVAESPLAMRTAGYGVEVALVLTFAVSTFVAALSGELQGMVYKDVSPLNFDPITSFIYFAVVLISVGSEPWYALVPAAFLSLLPVYVTSSNTTNYLQLSFGVAAVSLALAKQPQSKRLVGALRAFFDRFAHPPAYATIDTVVARAAVDPHHLLPQPAVDLEVAELAVRFGGLSAVQNLHLTARAGHITGLIGPNGAGKTTALNACSGLINPSRGQVILGGRSILGLGIAKRARLGLGRTFQLMELCDSLTVWENIVMAREAVMAGANSWRQVVSRRGEGEAVKEAVSLAIARCGLTPLAGVQVGSLSSSQRRLVEIARCLAGSFRVLLLDEPSSGLDRVATERLGQILRSIADEDGLGILLVEHDMSLVMSICDYIYVMEFGTPIFEGEPAAVQSSDRVRAAYLGGVITPMSPTVNDADRS